MACLVPQFCAFLTPRVTVFGDHEAFSTAWPLVSYLNSMVSFYRYLFRRLLCSLCEIKALYAATRFAVGLADRLLAVFFRSAGFYTAISCQPKDKLTDISVDCVLAYRTDRCVRRRSVIISITHVILSSYVRSMQDCC